MNLYGSYRALLGNAVSAMCAAIEIYNKPKLEYRDETAIILIVNAWELLTKAILSKNRHRIYYPKKRNQAYRTYSVSDAIKKVRQYFPQTIDYDGTAGNLSLLIEYRDTAVHFYHKEGLEIVIYTLAQTAVVNFRDVVLEVFERDLADEISLSLLPLSFSPPVEPIEFLRTAPDDPELSSHVRDFTGEIVRLVQKLDEQRCDIGRLFTVFEVNLVSTKKLESADLVVGVQSETPEGGKLLVQKRTDPNLTHPHRMSDIVSVKSDPDDEGMGIEYDGRKLGSYEFQAVVHTYQVRERSEWCWRDGTGAVTRYSPGFVRFLKDLSRKELEDAVEKYKQI